MSVYVCALHQIVQRRAENAKPYDRTHAGRNVQLLFLSFRPQCFIALALLLLLLRPVRTNTNRLGVRAGKYPEATPLATLSLLFTVLPLCCCALRDASVHPSMVLGS